MCCSLDRSHLRSVRNRIYRGLPAFLRSVRKVFFLPGKDLSTFSSRHRCRQGNGEMGCENTLHTRGKSPIRRHKTTSIWTVPNPNEWVPLPSYAGVLISQPVIPSLLSDRARSSIYPSPLSSSGQSYRIRSQSRRRPSVLRQTSPPIVSGGRAVAGTWNGGR